LCARQDLLVPELVAGHLSAVVVENHAGVATIAAGDLGSHL
jgi:hypothetical protein